MQLADVALGVLYGYRDERIGECGRVMPLMVVSTTLVRYRFDYRQAIPHRLYWVQPGVHPSRSEAVGLIGIEVCGDHRNVDTWVRAGSDAAMMPTELIMASSRAAVWRNIVDSELGDGIHTPGYGTNAFTHYDDGLRLTLVNPCDLVAPYGEYLHLRDERDESKRRARECDRAETDRLTTEYTQLRQRAAGLGVALVVHEYATRSEIAVSRQDFARLLELAEKGKGNT